MTNYDLEATVREIIRLYLLENPIQASTVGGLTASSAVVSDSSGNLTASSTTAAQIAALPRVIVKGTTTTRNDTDTLAADPDLTFTVATDSTYLLDFILHFQMLGSSDFKYDMTLPANATGISLASSVAPLLFGDADGSQTGGAAYSVGSGANYLGTGAVNSICRWTIKIETTDTAGSATFRWAQNTAVAEDTSVFAGSTMIVWKLI